MKRHFDKCASKTPVTDNSPEAGNGTKDPYECRICKEQFLFKYGLQDHMAVHLSEDDVQNSHVKEDCSNVMVRTKSTKSKTGED